MYLAPSTNCGHRSNLNLEVLLVFEEMGKPEYPDKNLSEQQTQPTYDVESGNRTRATLLGGECSHHCAIPALPEQNKKETRGWWWWRSLYQAWILS